MKKCYIKFTYLNIFNFFSWTGRIHWGCEYSSQRFSNSKIPQEIKESQSTKKVVLSLTEPSELVERLKPHYECISTYQRPKFHQTISYVGLLKKKEQD